MHKEVHKQKDKFGKIRDLIKSQSAKKEIDLTEKVLEQLKPNFVKDSDFTRKVINDSMTR